MIKEKIKSLDINDLKKLYNHFWKGGDFSRNDYISHIEAYLVQYVNNYTITKSIKSLNKFRILYKMIKEI
jgi:hypothetical protein